MVDPEMCFVVVDKRYGRKGRFWSGGDHSLHVSIGASLCCIYQASVSFTDDKGNFREDAETAERPLWFCRNVAAQYRSPGLLELIGEQGEWVIQASVFMRLPLQTHCFHINFLEMKTTIEKNSAKKTRTSRRKVQPAAKAAVPLNTNVVIDEGAFERVAIDHCDISP